MQSDWVDSISGGGSPNDYSWLSGINSPPSTAIRKIATFGCCTSEPLFLLSLFEAKEIFVIEKDEDALSGLKLDIEKIEKRFPSVLSDRKISCIIRDMSEPIDGLSSDYFDLAFCQRTLRYVNTENHLREAIHQMARIVKPGGFVIAADEKWSSFSDENIAYLFEVVGLKRTRSELLPSCPRENYFCYQKPLEGK